MAGVTSKSNMHYKKLVEDPANASLKEKYTRKMNEMQQFTENFIFLAEQQRSKDKDVLRLVYEKAFKFCTHYNNLHVFRGFLRSGTFEKKEKISIFSIKIKTLKLHALISYCVSNKHGSVYLFERGV